MNLEEIRQSAEQQDAAILRMLAQRTRYPIDINLYLERKHPILEKDSCLSRYINYIYLPILRKICSQGKIKKQDLDFIIESDRKIAFAIVRRTTEIGAEVANYKEPRGLPVYIPEIEEKKMQERIHQAEKENLGLTTKQIESAFNYIFQETKRIEEIVIKNGTMEAAGGEKTIITDCPVMAKKIKKQLEHEASLLKGNHSVGEKYSERNPHYTLTLY